MEYVVSLADREVGKAELTKQGLYYRVVCRCSLPEGGMCRLVAENGQKSADLGILVPEQGMFGLETRFPIRKLGEGNLSFRILTGSTAEKRTYVPIKPEEPFAYLARLKNAFLEIRDGQKGANIPL